VSASTLRPETRALAARLAAGAAQPPRRTFQPVRRNSRHAGERELRIWKQENVFQADERRARLRAVREYDRQHKLPGKVMGPIGRVGVELYDELLGMRDFRSGRLDPALETIARRLRVAKQTVVAALARLKAHGFIDWFRRTRPVDDNDGRTVEQDTNAYWFKVPKWAADRVRAALRRPTPACAAAHAQAQRAELAAMLDAATPEERIAFNNGAEGDLTSALLALQRSLSLRGVASPATGLNPEQEVK
jgi:hypothetical protein